MYVEEKIDLLLEEVKRLREDVELFIPDISKEKGVIHFLEITKTTFNTYIREEVLENGLHYVMNKNKKVFIPQAIKDFKKSGQVGRKRNDSKIETLDTINKNLSTIRGSRSATKGIL